MKIFIVGLGLMGSSFAESLTKNKHQVYGYDINNEYVNHAVTDKVIIGSDFKDLESADIVMMCLYPKDNLHFIKENKSLFKNQLLTDISGTKIHMVKQINDLLPNIRYVSTHPMAGREKVGYLNKDITMFKKANFLIIETNTSTLEDINLIEELAQEIGFSRITKLLPDSHDKLIAHTSQLTHLLAVALMLSDNNELTKEATGDSYRDLTRIAKINEVMWTELFMDNKDVLIDTTNNFINKLEELKSLILNEQTLELKEELKKSKEKRISFDDFKN